MFVAKRLLRTLLNSPQAGCTILEVTTRNDFVAKRSVVLHVILAAAFDTVSFNSGKSLKADPTKGLNLEDFCF